MTTVYKDTIIKSLQDLGIKQGDTVIVHSSFKSMGFVDGGAETVISAFLDVIGEEGTLVFPTLVQKDFENAYKTWHMDKPSDVGYLTEYFRKREGSLRSDQATHSVAACGKYAAYLTETHGHTHKRFGDMGDTPFSADSPWQKMYEMDAKTVLLGVDERKITFRHLAEYMYIEECLDSISHIPEKRQEMEDGLEHFCHQPGAWPHVYAVRVFNEMKKEGIVIPQTTCGDATVTAISSKFLVDYIMNMFRSGNREAIGGPEAGAKFIEWENELKRIKNENKL